MSKTYKQLDGRLQKFICAQKMFFVGSAPRSDDGFINISPKGFDSFRILNPKTVAYLDYTGSGIEAIANIKENGRLVIVFCSFDEKPLILRLYGRATVIEKSDVEWRTLQPLFPDVPAARAIIKLPIQRITDSCGWGVPFYQYKGLRDQYPKYIEKVGRRGLRQAQLKSNMASINGLPGLKQPSVD